MTERVGRKERLGELMPKEVSLLLARLALDASVTPDQEAIIAEASKRLEQFDRLTRLLSQLAPGGTAPRTALEEIYRQSATNEEVSPVVLDVRDMLEHHWAEWTPALREAEGLPPIEET